MAVASTTSRLHFRPRAAHQCRIPLATFEELTFTGIYEDLIDSLIDRLPAALVGHVRDLLAFFPREEWLSCLMFPA